MDANLDKIARCETCPGCGRPVDGGEACVSVGTQTAGMTQAWHPECFRVAPKMLTRPWHLDGCDGEPACDGDCTREKGG